MMSYFSPSRHAAKHYDLTFKRCLQTSEHARDSLLSSGLVIVSFKIVHKLLPESLFVRKGKGMTLKKKDIIREVRRYLLILFGCAVCGVGINLFILPANLLTNGLGGIAILLYYLAGWPVGVQILVYNLPILYLAHRFMGRRYAVDTILGTVLFSLGIDVFSSLSSLHPVQDTMLNAIFGGVVSGIGYGLIFRFGSNTGGVDVLGAILKKYWSIDVGTGVFLLNMLVIAASAALFDLVTALGRTSFSARDVADTVAREVCFGDDDKLAVATVKHQTCVR